MDNYIVQINKVIGRRRREREGREEEALGISGYLE